MRLKGQSLLVMCFVMALMYGRLVSSTVILEQNKYKGLVVAISPDIKETNGENLIKNIKDYITDASKTLFTATFNRAYFHEVKILIPKSWTKTKVDGPALKENYKDSEIKVVTLGKTENSSKPEVDHPDECGYPGREIQLPLKFFKNKAGRDDIPSLVMSWATFRWGVFGEHGVKKDPLFPYFYQSPTTGKTTVNRCTNIPDDVAIKCPGGTNCHFVDKDIKDLSSSLMSATFFDNSKSTIKKMKWFCTDKTHNAKAPTKHNKVCKRRSVWSVMNEHKDFANGANQPTETYNAPNFEVIQEGLPNYALVLDFSVSMADQSRAEKLKAIAKSWIMYQVANGSSVAVIKFGDKAKEVLGFTVIGDEATRNEVARAIDKLKIEGGTSIGDGLRKAVEYFASKELADKGNKVILLVTDGGETHSPCIKDVREELKTSNARVVTVAFSEAADVNLESLAKDTNGKTFFVKDKDPLNKLGYAFEGALTYQPTPLTSEVRVVIHEPEPYSGTETEIGESFTVDSNLGRNLEFRLRSYKNKHVTVYPQLVSPNKTHFSHTKFDKELTTWYIHVEKAEKGEWQWKVGLSGTADGSVEVQVSSQSWNADVPPITTEAMMDVVPKTLSDGKKYDLLKVTAKVKQGTYPVIRANVSAYVTPPGENAKPITVILKDDGEGADSTKDDGKYTQILTEYGKGGRYSIRAQVTGTNETQVIGSEFLTQKRRRRSADPEEEPEDDSGYCCSSVLKFDPDEAVSTGKFTRITSGESKVLTNPPLAGDDIMAPDKVYDFLVTTSDPWLPSQRYANVSLSWTAPGDDFSVGTVSGYRIWMSTNRTELSEADFELDPDRGMQGIAIDASDVEIGEAGTKVKFTTSIPLIGDGQRFCYFVLRAVDDTNLTSPWSNTAILELLEPASDGGMPLWAIVVVVLVVTFSFGAVVYFLVRSQIFQRYVINSRDTYATVPMKEVP